MVAPFMGPRKIFPNTSHSLLSKLGCMGPVFYFSTLITYGICQARISAWRVFFLGNGVPTKEIAAKRMKLLPRLSGWFARENPLAPLRLV